MVAATPGRPTRLTAVDVLVALLLITTISYRLSERPRISAAARRSGEQTALGARLASRALAPPFKTTAAESAATLRRAVAAYRRAWQLSPNSTSLRRFGAVLLLAGDQSAFPALNAAAHRSGAIAPFAVPEQTSGEAALWRRLTQPKPLPPTEIPDDIVLLKGMGLGDLEPLLEARLYQAARLVSDGSRVTATVRLRQLRRARSEAIRLLLNALGAAAWAIFIFAWLIWRDGPAGKANAPSGWRPTYTQLAFAFCLHLLLPEADAALTWAMRSTSHPGRQPTPGGSALLVVWLLIYTACLLAPVLALKLCAGRTARWREVLAVVGLKSHRKMADAAAGVLALLLLLPVSTIATAVSSWLFQSFYTPRNPVEHTMLNGHTGIHYLFVLSQSCIVAPVVEETVFRGMLFPALSMRWGLIGGAVGSSAIFALLHPTLPSGFLPLWIFGMIACFVYARRGSLLPGIVMHGLYNGLLLVTLVANYGP